MADSFSKKEREKKKQKRKQEKAEKKKQRELEEKNSDEFVYLDEFGNFTDTPPDLSKKKEVKLEDIRISTPKDSELEQESAVREGYVKFFNEDKRFGFIMEKGTQNDYFVHEDNLIDSIRDRDKVTFEIGTGPKGLIAINVKLLK